MSCIFLISGLVAMSQNSLKEPVWVSGRELPQSKWFDYFIGIGHSSYSDSARFVAVRSAIREYAESQGMTFIVSSGLQKEEIATANDSKYKILSNIKFQTNVKGLEKTVTIPCMQIVAFYEKLGNLYYVLVRIPKTAQTDCEKRIYVGNGSSVWRSALIPGWGQLYKKQKALGWSILAMESSAVALSLFSHYQYNSNYDLANTVTNPVLRQDYINTAENWANIRTISMVSAGVIYVINLFDAILSKGEPRYTNGPVILYPSMFQNQPVMTFALKLERNK